MYRRVSIALISILPATTAWAFYSPDEAPVINVPVSARASALGNSAYCLPDEGIHYNPAYLGDLGGGSLFGTYGSYGQGTQFGYVSSQWKIGCSGWSISAAEVRSAFENYSGPRSVSLGMFTVSQSLFSLGIGIKSGNGYWGIAGRMLIDRIDTLSQNAYTADAGAGYALSKRIKAGIVVKNAVSDAGNSDDAQRLKTVFSGCVHPAIRLGGQKDDNENSLYFSFIKGMFSSPYASLGWESRFYGFLSLRAGYDRDYPATGIGFDFGPVYTDFAGVMKDEGFVYFGTFGWSFGNKPVVEPEKKRPAVVNKPKSRQARIETLLKEGRMHAGKSNYHGALLKFKEVLKLDPVNTAALCGIEEAKAEREKQRIRNEVRRCIADGQEALRKREYLKAESSYRRVLSVEPQNETAKDGIKMSVEYLLRTVRESLLAGTTAQAYFSQLNRAEALQISGSGTLENLAAAGGFLAKGEFIKGYGELVKVRPEGINALSDCAAVCDELRKQELAKLMEDAGRLAQEGSYREAIKGLEGGCLCGWISDEEAVKIKGLIATYEYMGEMVASTYLPEATGLISKKEYIKASVYLKRVIKSGFEAEAAGKLLKGIEPHIKQQSIDNNAKD